MIYALLTTVCICQAQWAPFDAFYSWNNATYLTIEDPTISELNTYRGSVYQQTTSIVSKTNQDCYYANTGCYSVYGFEYKEGYEKDSKCTSFGLTFRCLTLLFVQMPTYLGLTMESMCREWEREV